MIKINNKGLFVRSAFVSQLTGVVEFRWELCLSRKDYKTNSEWLVGCSKYIQYLNTFTVWDGEAFYLKAAD